MSNSDPICAHGIYLANCPICRSRMELGLPLMRDCCSREQYEFPILRPWLPDEKWENLLKAAERILACADPIYAGSYRVSSDSMEKLKEIVAKVKEG